MVSNLFGKRVRCYGYLKKQKVKYVVADKEDKIYQDDPLGVLVLDGEPIEQNTYVREDEIFDGIVIGTKRVSTRNFYDYDFYGRSVVVMKHGVVDCYVIAYQMNRKRYVPKDTAASFITYNDGAKARIIAIDDLPTKKPDKKALEEQYKIYQDMISGRFDKELGLKKMSKFKMFACKKCGCWLKTDCIESKKVVMTSKSKDYVNNNNLCKNCLGNSIGGSK